MSQEQVERNWFRRIATIMLLAALTYGSVPLIKNTFFAAEKSRR